LHSVLRIYLTYFSSFYGLKSIYKNHHPTDGLKFSELLQTRNIDEKTHTAKNSALIIQVTKSYLENSILRRLMQLFRNEIFLNTGSLLIAFN
jgi:hypothetical protein